MDFKSKAKIIKTKSLKVEKFGEVSRQVLFSPKTSSNKLLKMAYIDVPPGSIGTAHVHLGEELVYTLKGHAILEIEGEEYHLEQGTCCLIPPEIPHPAKVVGEGNWVALAAYCDECPVLKKARSKEGESYPKDM